MAEVAHSEPSLRRLSPFTSHFRLHFSPCTGFPHARDVPHVEPSPGGRHRIHRTAQTTGPGFRAAVPRGVGFDSTGLGPPRRSPPVSAPRDQALKVSSGGAQGWRPEGC
ncbi:hypothetical protein EDD39_6991 [Kitasatospora cineracea]|uniref:Uncharacterized protein n=1 Tax=Kitasatospora cineracea TaxID=88074 RepID=A0A8G1U9I9_9ACTN|nr:hypothetical protein EDD39_6991 [Kitasatospora cineracea]